MIGAKELLIIGVAVTIAAYLLIPHKPVSLPNLAADQHGYGEGYDIHDEGR